MSAPVLTVEQSHAQMYAVIEAARVLAQSHETLRAERDELQQECNDAAERLRWGVEEIGKVRAERDAALAEVARMRPVVEMALERRAIHLAAGDDEAEQERRGLLHAEVAEDLAVDAYRTEVQP